MNKEFRDAVADVEPLARTRRRVAAKPAADPVPRQTRRDERAALAESLAGPVSADDVLESGEELSFLG
jgi:hypothetical protein